MHTHVAASPRRYCRRYLCLSNDARSDVRFSDARHYSNAAVHAMPLLLTGIVPTFLVWSPFPSSFLMHCHTIA